MSFADREPLRKRFPCGPYANLGPVVIEGAEPGDVVECQMLETYPIDWGWNSFPLGVGALPRDFDEPYVHYFRFSEDQRTTHRLRRGRASRSRIPTAGTPSRPSAELGQHLSRPPRVRYREALVGFSLGSTTVVDQRALTATSVPRRSAAD